MNGCRTWRRLRFTWRCIRPARVKRGRAAATRSNTPDRNRQSARRPPWGSKPTAIFSAASVPPPSRKSTRWRSAASAGSGGAPAFFKILSKDQWSSILRALLPSAWLQTQVESALSQAFRILEQPGAPLSITLDMRELKNRLTGPSGTDAVMQIIQTLPACPAGYIPDPTNPSQLLDCKPPDEAMPQFTPLISKALADATAGIPDQLDVLKELRDSGAINVETLGLPIGPREVLQIGRWVVRLSPILGIAILLIVTLLVVRSWKGFLRWWGYPLLAAGAAVLLTAIILWVGLDVLVSLGRENLPASVSIDGYDTVAGILVFIIHRYSLVTGAEGIVLGLIGAGLLAASFFVGRGKRAPGATTPPAAAPPSPVSPPPPPDDASHQSGIFGISRAPA
jgi:hypothetical protein